VYFSHGLPSVLRIISGGPPDQVKTPFATAADVGAGVSHSGVSESGAKGVVNNLRE